MNFKDDFLDKNLQEGDMKYEALGMAKELHSQLANLTFINMLGVMSPDNPAKKEVQALETKVNELTNDVGEFIQKYIPDVADAEADDDTDIEQEDEEKPAPKPKKEKVEESYKFSDFMLEGKIDKDVETSMRKALKSKTNINKDGTINWNYIDADVYMDVNKNDDYKPNVFYKVFDKTADKLKKELKLRESSLQIIDYTPILERNSCGDMRFTASKKFEQKEYSMAMTIMQKHEFSPEEVVRQFHHVKLEKLLQMIQDAGINQ